MWSGATRRSLIALSLATAAAERAVPRGPTRATIERLGEGGRVHMIKLASIGHVLLRVADEEASKRFYRDVLGFRVAEQDPKHGGVFMTLGDGFHTLDIVQHPAPSHAVRP